MNWCLLCAAATPMNLPMPIPFIDAVPSPSAGFTKYVLPLLFTMNTWSGRVKLLLDPVRDPVLMLFKLIVLL